MGWISFAGLHPCFAENVTVRPLSFHISLIRCIASPGLNREVGALSWQHTRESVLLLNTNGVVHGVDFNSFNRPRATITHGEVPSQYSRAHSGRVERTITTSEVKACSASYFLRQTIGVVSMTTACGTMTNIDWLLAVPYK